MTDAPAPPPAAPSRDARTATRVGKKNIGAWLDEAYARSLLMARAATGKELQDGLPPCEWRVL